MKKKNPDLNEVIFHCISCNHEFITKGVTKKKTLERINSCVNCCPFFVGFDTSSIKIGAVEKFRSRNEKFNKKKKEQKK